MEPPGRFQDLNQLQMTLVHILASNPEADTAKIQKNSRLCLTFMGYESGINFVHTMIPLMSKLLSEAKFNEADMVF